MKYITFLCFAVITCIVFNGCAGTPGIHIQIDDVKTYFDIDKDFSDLRRFRIIQGNKENPLLEKELLLLAKDQLIQKGYIYDDEKPNFLLNIGFYCGPFQYYVPPKTIYLPYYVPGETSSFSGFAGNTYIHGTVLSPARFDIMPHTKEGYTVTQYYRKITVYLIDYTKWAHSEKVDVIWQGEISSSGSNSDIRIVAPYLFSKLLNEFPPQSVEQNKRIAQQNVELQKMMEQLKNENKDVRSSASNDLKLKVYSGEISSKKAITELIKLLNNTNKDVCRDAVITLSSLTDFGANEAVPKLIELLKDDDMDIRLFAGIALEGINDKESISKIIELLQYKNKDVCISAVQVLGNVGARKAIPELKKLLNDESWTVRSVTARALGKLGARSVTSELMKLLDDKDERVRTSAALALAEFGIREIIPILTKLLNSESVNIRWQAACALAEFGIKESIPELVTAYGEDEYRYRLSLKALISLHNKLPIPELVKSLNDERWCIRGPAAYALGKLDSKESVPQIEKLLNDENEYVRSLSALALGKIGAKESSPKLIKMLKDKGIHACGSAMISLVEIGEKAQLNHDEALIKINTACFELSALDDDIAVRQKKALKELGFEE